MSPRNYLLMTSSWLSLIAATAQPPASLVPARELKAFAKTRELKPGESQTLTFKVSSYGLASFNEQLSQWETAAGQYELQFAASSEDIRARVTYKHGKAQAWPVHNVMAPNDRYRASVSTVSQESGVVSGLNFPYIIQLTNIP